MSETKGSAWWQKEGVRFQCQGSGQCCISRGEYGYVFLTLKDRQRFARHFGMSTSAFTRKNCSKLGPAYHLKEDPARAECMFLKNNRCSAYEARPTQCRTWPFWPETMSAKAWKKEVVNYCPGAGKGPKRDPEDIARQIKEQADAEAEISGRLRGL